MGRHGYQPIDGHSNDARDTDARDDGENEAIDIDDILEKSGPFGRFQFLIQSLIMYFVLSVGYQVLITYFTGSNPPWTCVSNDTSTFCRQNYGRVIASYNSDFNKRCELDRHEWKYTKAKDFSFVTEYDLVCKREVILALISGSFFIGAAVGSIFSGIFADLYGRRLVLIICLSITIVLAIVTSFVKTIWQLILVRLLIGASHITCYSIAFIYLSEYIPPSYRILTANIFHLTYDISHLFLTATAYLLPRWRQLQFYTSFPSFITLILFFFLPKSPRWLLARAKTFEAEEALKKVFKVNGKPEVNFTLKSPPSTSTKTYTYIDLFTTSTATVLTLLQAFLWMAVGLIYFTVILETSNLGDNIYESYTLSTVGDIPSNFVAAYACYKIGRKKTTLAGLMVACVLTAFVPLIPNSISSSIITSYAIRIGLAVLARFFSHCAFNGIYIWTFELFPTVVRMQGWSVCEVVLRLSGAAAPFFTSVLRSINVYIPYSIVCFIGVSAALLALRLPETIDMPTRENYEDIFTDTRGSPPVGDVVQNDYVEPKGNR